MNLEALRLAIEDLSRTYPDQYKNGAAFLQRLEALEEKPDEPAFLPCSARPCWPIRCWTSTSCCWSSAAPTTSACRRTGRATAASAATATTTRSPCSRRSSPQGKLTTLSSRRRREFVGDVDLHFDADKLLFSMPGKHGRWQIWEIKADGSGLRQVTPGDEPDVDNYDACYLPDGRIVFASSRCFHGVPCVGGGNTVANLCIMDADGTGIRQLCFDQDHELVPDRAERRPRALHALGIHRHAALLHPAAVPHEPGRHGPDGVLRQQLLLAQLDLLRPADPRPSDEGRGGDLRAPRRAADGRAGRVRSGQGPLRGRRRGAADPGPRPEGRADHRATAWSTARGRSSCIPIRSATSTSSSPASRRRSREWGIYLVDVFDNMVLIKEQAGYVLVRAGAACGRRPGRRSSPTASTWPSKDATVYLADVYRGPGPEGRAARHGQEAAALRTALRLSAAWAGTSTSASTARGTSSASSAPCRSRPTARPASACRPTRPIAVQPLDAEGKAVQLMRSWFTAMPGESRLVRRLPRDAEHGPAEQADHRQPARGRPRSRRGTARRAASASSARCSRCWTSTASAATRKAPSRQRPGRARLHRQERQRLSATSRQSYVALHPFVRRPGPESDYHLLKPLEFHADTSELVQMLKRGHYDVKLDAEAWDRLDHLDRPERARPRHLDRARRRPRGPEMQRRLEMRAKYANRTDDPEAIPEPSNKEPIKYRRARAAARAQAAGPARGRLAVRRRRGGQAPGRRRPGHRR